jgi:hypothetical protein
VFEVDVAVSVLGQHLVVFFAREGRLPKRNEVEDDSDAENIADGAVLGLEIFEVDHFRGHITRRAAPDEHVVFLAVLSKPEVSNNTIKISVLSQQNILRLEIAMHDALAVHDLKSF